MMKKIITFLGLLLIMVATVMTSCYSEKYRTEEQRERELTALLQKEEKEHLTREQLERLSADELVREYGKDGIQHLGCLEYGKLIVEIIMKRPKEVFLAVAKVFDDYDPTTFKGRMHHKDVWASWALALISYIDNNVFRIRAIEEGRIALEALQKELKRKKAAGHDTDKVDYGWKMLYKSEMSVYNEMLGANARDDDIARQLKEEYQIQLSDEELRKFSDFLITKDPAYYSWGDLVLGSGKPIPRFNNMIPYYDAYLEFKKSEKCAK